MTDAPTQPDAPKPHINRLPTRKPGPRPKRKRGNPLTPRRRAFIQALVWDAAPLSQAAKQAGFTEQAGRDALRDPQVLTYYKQELAALRTAAQAGNISTVQAIRDDTALRASAAGANAIINAASYLDTHGQDRAAGVLVNIGIGIQQSAPGYMIDTSRYDPAQVAAILGRSGSRESLLDLQANPQPEQQDEQRIEPRPVCVAQQREGDGHASTETQGAQRGKLIAHQPLDQGKALTDQGHVGPGPAEREA